MAVAIAQVPKDVPSTVNIPAPDLNGIAVADAIDYQIKYKQERDKRVRDDTINQYLDPATSPHYRRFVEDPWVESGLKVNQVVADGGHSKVLIVGAGFGGMVYAVRLLQAGFKIDDLLFVDPAGGFGGTWYWNRYPGLMCDVESYIYLPLLEEMNYMPKQKYSKGEEIREYCQMIAEKYAFETRAMLQSSVSSVTWKPETREWVSTITQKPKGGEKKDLTVRSDFVIFAIGVLAGAKVPDVPGIDSFAGETFHTVRWDYGVTGGSPAQPDLTNLKDKKVGIIGTGATAIQVVPQVAKWAKQTLVFQRTPAGVDHRDNRETTAEEWKQITASGPGWQQRRNDNFNAYMNNDAIPPKEDLVDDQWTKMLTYSAVIGGKYNVDKTNVEDHVKYLHALDFPRQERVRKRVTDTVHDRETAMKLQPWYPTWCKRPTFHDDYLKTFNNPSVRLVDTDGHGVDAITPRGVVFNGREYDVDVLIWSTGYAANKRGSAPAKANIEVRGIDGASFEDVYRNEWATLHGIINRSFPNMFQPGPAQASATANFTYVVDTLAKHAAYMMAAGSRLAAQHPGSPKPVLRPTAAAQDEWLATVQTGALMFAGVKGCTPSWLNSEGLVDKMTPEQRAKASRNMLLPGGFQRLVDILEGWRMDGGLRGLDVLPSSV